jgi:hypothetical protein
MEAIISDETSKEYASVNFLSENRIIQSATDVRSIGLWRWYINITITILEIIHRPVFYLKLNSTL